MSDYRTLKVWQRAHGLTLRIYGVTSRFPRDERFGLTDQLRRAAASVPANLAEGVGRGTSPEFARFCRISTGSLNELEYYLLLGHDLCYLQTTEYESLVDEIGQIRRMLTRLQQRLP